VNCPECKARMTEEVGSHQYLGDELPNVKLVGVKLRTCPECGYSSVSIPKLAKLHRALVREIARQPRKLEPGEIRFLRKHLGWSGKDFAHNFGVTPETVSRWENGRADMGPVAERLLRLSALFLDPVQEYPLPDGMEERTTPTTLELTLDRDWQVRRSA